MAPATWMPRFLLISTTFLFSVCLFAQAEKKIGLKCSFWTVFDDNAFRNYEMLSDVVYQPDVKLYYAWSNDRSQFGAEYDGSFAFFQNYADRKFQHHFLNLSGSRILNDSATVSTYWSLGGGGRWNEPNYSYYNYGTANGFFNVRYEGAGWGSVGLGLSGQIQKYKNLSQFNFAETRAYVQPTFYLPTMSTLIGQIQLGYKKFTESFVNEEVIRRTVLVRTRGTNNGKGQNNGRIVPVTINRVVSVVSPGKSVLQFAGLARIAQSVFSGTGVAIQGMVRRNLKQDGRFLSFQDSGYEEEDPLYDDPYSYEGETLSVEWTQFFFWGMTFKAGWDGQNKRYSHAAYDADGNPIADTLRRDQRSLFWVNLKKTVRIRGFSPYPVLNVSWSYMKNRSNDLYYDYDNHAVSAGLSFGL